MCNNRRLTLRNKGRPGVARTAYRKCMLNIKIFNSELYKHFAGILAAEKSKKCLGSLLQTFLNRFATCYGS